MSPGRDGEGRDGGEEGWRDGEGRDGGEVMGGEGRRGGRKGEEERMMRKGKSPL